MHSRYAKIVLYFYCKRLLNTFYLAGLLDQKCKKKIKNDYLNIKKIVVNLCSFVLQLIVAVEKTEVYLPFFWLRTQVRVRFASYGCTTSLFSTKLKEACKNWRTRLEVLNKFWDCCSSLDLNYSLHAFRMSRCLAVLVLFGEQPDGFLVPNNWGPFRKVPTAVCGFSSCFTKGLIWLFRPGYKVEILLFLVSVEMVTRGIHMGSLFTTLALVNWGCS